MQDRSTSRSPSRRGDAGTAGSAEEEGVNGHAESKRAPSPSAEPASSSSSERALEGQSMSLEGQSMSMDEKSMPMNSAELAEKPAAGAPQSTETASTKNLFVTGLSVRAAEADLRALFVDYGNIEKLQIMRDPHSQESRGFAFIDFSTSAEADAALAGLNGMEFFEKSLIVQKAKRARARTPTPGSYKGAANRESFRERDRRGGGYDGRRPGPYDYPPPRSRYPFDDHHHRHLPPPAAYHPRDRRDPHGSGRHFDRYPPPPPHRYQSHPPHYHHHDDLAYGGGVSDGGRGGYRRGDRGVEYASNPLPPPAYRDNRSHDMGANGNSRDISSRRDGGVGGVSRGGYSDRRVESRLVAPSPPSYRSGGGGSELRRYADERDFPL